MGTVRCWWVFGLPNSTTPPTSVALSATVSRFTQEVDPADPQGRQLTEAKTGVGEQPHYVAVLRRRVGELFHLLSSEEPGLSTDRPGQRDAGGRVPRDSPVTDGER